MKTIPLGSKVFGKSRPYNTIKYAPPIQTDIILYYVRSRAARRGGFMEIFRALHLIVGKSSPYKIKN